MRDFFENKQFTKYLPVFMIMLALIVLMSSSYAILKSSSVGTKTYTMNVGKLEVDFYNTATDNNLILTAAVPMTDEEGMAQSDELIFTVKNTGNYKASYNVYIEETTASPNPTFASVLRYNNKKGSGQYSSPKTLSIDNYIDRGASLDADETVEYRVKMWLDESAYNTYMNKTFKGRIIIDATQYQRSGDKVLSNIENLKRNNPTCNYTVNDYDTNEELEATYISGPATGDCAIDFNYVWYSGKMWRIVAIYPDGTMKLVTDNNITSISYNETGNVTYYNKSTTAKSYMFQWLNEDFLDTLYNYENIIVHDNNTYWNATMPSSTTTGTKPAETDATMIPTTTSPVGLLNSYEYYEAYQNATMPTNYLKIVYNWWLLEPYYDETSPSKFRTVSSSGHDTFSVSPTARHGVRPSIILQSDVSLIGNGTSSNPYKIVGDKETPTYNTTLINDRLSGEYVKIQYQNNGENALSSLYRIVGIENNTTKLVAMDYVKENSTNKQLTFATVNTSGSGTIYGSGDTVDNNKTTWYSYLNGTGNDDGWFDNLPYVSLLTAGTYYMGNGDSSSYYNYKGSICATADITSPTRSCAKTSNAGTFYVGLLRYGEMFATQQGGDSSNSLEMWLITKYASTGSAIRYVSVDGSVSTNDPTNQKVARPTIHLNSNVKILSGSGTELDPFIVGL